MTARLSRLLSVAAGLAAIAALAAAPAPAVAEPAARSGVDDFSFESLHVDYELTRDAEGHSVLDTTETFVALFPDIDQNRGMVRAIPTGYGTVSTHPEVVGVTDGDGNPVPYELDTDEGDDGDEFLLVLVGDDSYVHGRTTYVIEYTQRDVTRYFASTNDVEFYWDVNGTGWAQQFGEVSATLHVDPDLASALTGDVACYTGYYGADDECPVQLSGGTVSARATDLGGYENVTIAVGFAPGTFWTQADRWIYTVLPWILAALFLAAVATVVWLRARVWRHAPGRGVVIPQYEGPEGVGVLQSAFLLDKDSEALAALVIQLVVTRTVRLVEHDKRAKSYSLEVLDPSGVDEDDLRAAKKLFGGTFEQGDVLVLSHLDMKLGDRIGSLLRMTRVGIRAGDDALLAKRASGLGVLVRVAVFLLGLGSLVLGVVAAIDGVLGGTILVILLVVFLGGFVVFGFAGAPWRRTERGSLLREHLLGVRDYLELAEADRIRMLQSPEGAERTPIAAGDDEAIVKLYERLLPYAVIWGIEDDWQRVLGARYATTPTDLEPTLAVVPLHTFTTSTLARSAFATTPPPPSSSSSSWSSSGGSSFSSFGGSGGGGFSGGGGGGGGGGGR